jgi:methyl-accepting chemotaxis protein
MNQGTIIAGLGLMLAGFTAGWYTNGLRMDNKLQKQTVTTLTKDVNRANDTIGNINTKLGEVVTKTQMAVDNTQVTLNAFADLRKQSNTAMEEMSRGTERLDNEIDRLGIPKCQFDVTNGVLWQQAGERANSGRRALYGPDGAAKD